MGSELNAQAIQPGQWKSKINCHFTSLVPWDYFFFIHFQIPIISSMQSREQGLLCHVYSSQFYVCLITQHFQLQQTSTGIHTNETKTLENPICQQQKLNPWLQQHMVFSRLSCYQLHYRLPIDPLLVVFQQYFLDWMPLQHIHIWQMLRAITPFCMMLPQPSLKSPHTTCWVKLGPVLTTHKISDKRQTGAPQE